MQKTAPDFTLKDQYGEEFNLYNNLDKPVILVFYPKDNTPVCTKQLCDYNDNYQKFVEAGVKIVGVSVDNEASHKAFAGQHKFEFPILSDTKKEVSRKYKALSLLGFSKRKIVFISTEKEIIFEDTVIPLNYQKPGSLLKKVNNKN